MSISKRGVQIVGLAGQPGIIGHDSTGLVVHALVGNSDMDPSAPIADDKLGTITTAGKIADSALPIALAGHTYNGTEISVSPTGFTVSGGTGALTVGNTLSLVGTNQASLNIAGGGTLVKSAFVDTTDADNITTGLLSSNRIEASLIGHTYDGITNAAMTTGFAMSGGQNPKTLTVQNDIIVAGPDGSTVATLDPSTGKLYASQIPTVGAIVTSVDGRHGDVVLTAPDIGGLAPSATIDTTNASNITSGTLANARTTATSLNVPNTIVSRDGTNNFAAGTITANLIGNAATATNAVSSVDFTGNLAGDVIGSQSATVVSTVGGQTASNVATATATVLSATSADVPSTIATRDASGNIYANVVIADVNGSASNNVLKAGDTMTGTLVLPSGTSASPALAFTGSTTSGLSAASGALNLIASGQTGLSVGASGTVSITNLGAVGVVHNDNAGNLTTSLVVNADVAPNAAIIDGKLATITSTGKVANSATTATSANTASAIVSRDTNGDFTAGIITASLNGNAATATLAASATTATTAGAAAVLTGPLLGDITGTQSATVVSTVGGQTASNVATATTAVLSATALNMPSTLVSRDANGTFATNMITISGTVTNPTDVATKAYADAAASTGLVQLPSATAMSTTQTTLSGLQTIDDVVLVANDRVLLVGQTSSVQNGVWLAQTGSWTRPTDFATGNEASRALILILQGTYNGGTSWLCNTPFAVIDTNPITFAQFALPGSETGVNVGSGAGQIFRDKIGNNLNFKSILAGQHVVVTNDANDVALSTDATSANVASTLVARDVGGAFAGSLTGAASSNVLKAGDTMTGNLVMAGQTQVRLGDGGSNYVAIGAPATVSASYALTLPSSAPLVNQKLVVSQTNPSTLTWQSGMTGSVPSATQTIAISQAGNDVSGNGSIDFPYRSLAKALTIANSLSAQATPVSILVYPGLYIEDNSVGPLALTANGISVVGTSSIGAVIAPGTAANTLLTVSATSWFTNVQFNSGGSPLATGVSISGATAQIVFNNVNFVAFNIAVSTNSTSELTISNCYFTGSNLAVNTDNAPITITGCTIQGNGASTGLQAFGASAIVSIDSSSFSLHANSIVIGGNASAVANSLSFTGINSQATTDCEVVGGSSLNMTGSQFMTSVSSGTLTNISASGSGTTVRCTACSFVLPGTQNGNQTAISVSGVVNCTIANCVIRNYSIGVAAGAVSDTSATITRLSAIDCIGNTVDIAQAGTSTLIVQSSNIDSTKLTIGNSTNVSLCYNDAHQDGALAVGTFANADTPLVIAETGAGSLNPQLLYSANLYGRQAIGHNSPGANSFLSSIGASDNGVVSVTTDRTKQSGIYLFSDQGATVGSTSALRGWTMTKTGTNASLEFTYQNTDVVGQAAIPEYVLMTLDGVNGQLLLPDATAQIVIGGDTNLYRLGTSTLATSGNVVIGGLTANTALTANSSKQLTSSITTDTELSYLSGTTSGVQTQLNGKVSKTGDTMTGTLVLPVGTTSAPSLSFAATSAGLSASGGTLALTTNALGRLLIDSSGNIQVATLGLGIGHFDGSGNLTSSAIVDADVSATASIQDSKLATIATAGKVANSALPAAFIGHTYDGITNTANTVGFSVAGGTTPETLTIANTLTLAGTNGSTLNVGAGGTLGALAFMNTLAANAGGTGQTTYAVGDILYASGTTALSRLPIGANGTVLTSNGTTPAYAPVSVSLSSATGVLGVANGGTGLSTLTQYNIPYASTSTSFGQIAPSSASGVALVSTGANSAPAFGAINLASSSAIVGALAVANGGTGQTTYTDGQLLIGSTSGSTLLKATLSSSDGSVSITNASGSISLTISASNIASGILSVARGGTGLTSLTQYNIPYASSTGAFGQIAPSATFGVPLVSTGASSAPAFGPVNLASSSAVTGVLSVANGGTGLSTLTQYNIPYASTASTLGEIAPSSTTGVALVSAGPSSAPTFGAVNVGSSNAVSGTLAVANGGTGQASYTNGQLLIGNSTGNTLAIGTLSSGDGSVAIANGAGTISLAVNASNIATGTVPVAHGGTGLTSYTQGALIYASTTGTLAGLSDDSTAGVPLVSGGANTAPSYAALNLASSTAITGNLPIANLNGGTGASSSTFWRGDGTWAAAGSFTNYYDFIYTQLTQSITNPGANTPQYVQLDATVFGNWTIGTTTFQCPSAGSGTYMFIVTVNAGGPQGATFNAALTKNTALVFGQTLTTIFAGTNDNTPMTGSFITTATPTDIFQIVMYGSASGCKITSAPSYTAPVSASITITRIA